ncbi:MULTISPECIES: hypothetical protein [Paenibacillus]|uniref:YiaAB two helix domain-containing protein n=1 Tax=Paenibacillus gallinarum TaxID=2762232 RepID=A0ABR8T693_9BACL|nr:MULTISPECIES: hypothetical protein [Paenibacillus]MBD7971275.1 hypothetical protein [Paenibacillus gallinarum]
MRRGLKWTLWSTSTFVISGIVLNFYLNYFTIGYAMIGVLLLLISGWGYLVQAKNDVNMVMDQKERGSYQGIIEQYTR